MRAPAIMLSLCLITVSAWAQFATITQDVSTEFGLYRPSHSQIRPSLPMLPPQEQGVNPEDVENLAQVGLSPKEQQRLLQQGFLAQPTQFPQMIALYQSLQKRGLPILVTTDAVLHAYHILYDYTLRLLEVERFMDDLIQLTDQMLQSAQAQLQAAETPLAQEAARRNVAFFQIAAELLRSSTLNPSPGLEDLALQELKLIYSHAGIVSSPLFGYPEDYTQYIPRGHYTRNETLKRFFRAMMWYGRMGFRLSDVSEEATRIQTLQALLITAAIEADPEHLRLWDRIYEPTVFFVGKADDLTVRQYHSVAIQVYGEKFASLSPDALADQLDAFIQAAQALPPPQINASVIRDTQDFQVVTRGFRFMGQRFIPDSYILFQLTHKRVEGRFLPRGLDVMAVLGSRRAYQILTEVYGERRYPRYQSQLEKLQDEFAAMDEATWAQNLYWNWLYVLMPLLDEKGEGYPQFMRQKAWADKELATALGSWAELRHDTILYAKQGYTEVTSIPPQPPLTRGYVEPNPELYARLASLARLMREGLDARGLTIPAFAERLERFEALLQELQAISEAELTGQPLTEAQYRTIWEFGDTLEYLNSFPPGVSSQIEGEEDRDMAVIADVHTDPNSGQVLEEGVGHPLLLSVLVPEGDAFKVCQGGMFAYYEFPHPMADRLTDAKWQDRIRQGIPKLPVWMNSFVTKASFEAQTSHQPHPRWDVNGDGLVDVLDMVRLAKHFGGSTRTRRAWLDMNDDGVVDILDLVVIGRHFGERIALAAPAISTPSESSFPIQLIRRDTGEQTLVELRVPPECDIRGFQFSARFAPTMLESVRVRPGAYTLPGARAEGRVNHFASVSLGNQTLNHSGVLATLVFARHEGPLDLQLTDVRLVDADERVLDLPTLTLQEVPEKRFSFRLLPNFPNPFNPDTWIPFELPRELPVSLEIYDATGRQIRRIDLGKKAAGRYVDREEAIHWDGTNDAGERVASGVYFVRLSAGPYTAQRRVVVVK